MNVLASGGFWAFVGVVAGIYTILALGLQLQFGFAGLLNFGHHPPQHAWMALSEGVLFGVLGCSDLRKRMGRRA